MAIVFVVTINHRYNVNCVWCLIILIFNCLTLNSVCNNHKTHCQVQCELRLIFNDQDLCSNYRTEMQWNLHACDIQCPVADIAVWFQVDYDECALGTSHCQQGCKNTLQSYKCFCYRGYMLDGTGYYCKPKLVQFKGKCSLALSFCKYKVGS